MTGEKAESKRITSPSPKGAKTVPSRIWALTSASESEAVCVRRSKSHQLVVSNCSI